MVVEGRLTHSGERREGDYSLHFLFKLADVSMQGHAEFSGGRQQDASEYYMHFLQVRIVCMYLYVFVYVCVCVWSVYVLSSTHLFGACARATNCSRGFPFLS